MLDWKSKLVSVTVYGPQGRDIHTIYRFSEKFCFMSRLCLKIETL